MQIKLKKSNLTFSFEGRSRFDSFRQVFFLIKKESVQIMFSLLFIKKKNQLFFTQFSSIRSSMLRSFNKYIESLFKNFRQAFSKSVPLIITVQFKGLSLLWITARYSLVFFFYLRQIFD
jgi:hypothetical protein